MVSCPFGRFRRTLRAAVEAREEGRLEDALRLFQQARKPDGRDPRPRLQQALTLAEAGKLAEAESVLDEARALGRDPAMVHLFLGLVHLEKGDAAAARAAFTEARTLEPENHLALSGAALARWDMGERKAAAAELLHDPFVHASSFEALLLLRVERFWLDQARRRGEPMPLCEPWAHEEEPRGPLLFEGIARAWRRRRAQRFRARAAACALKKDPLEELKWIDRVLELTPDDMPLFKERDRARRQALKGARRQLRKEKADPDLFFEVGCLSVLCGAPEEGVRMLDAWRDHHSRGGGMAKDAWHVEYALALKGQAQAALGRLDEAQETLAELCAFNTLDAYPRHLLGRCLLAKGDPRGARRAFKEALEFEPGFARHRLRALARHEGWRRDRSPGEGGKNGEAPAGGAGVEEDHDHHMEGA